MTSISAMSSNMVSPNQLLQNELQSEISSGTISSSDNSALSSAIDSINSTLQSDQGADQSNGPPSPDEMKSKIESLIDDQVSKGNLTGDQGTELKNVFSKAFAHGPGGAGGTPPGEGQEDDTTSATGSSSQTVQDFLKLLAQANSSDSSYNADGSTTSSTSAGQVVSYSS